MVSRIIICAVLFGGCQTVRLDDGTEVNALVIPVANQYEDTWQLVKLATDAIIPKKENSNGLRMERVRSE